MDLSEERALLRHLFPWLGTEALTDVEVAQILAELRFGVAPEPGSRDSDDPAHANNP